MIDFIIRIMHLLLPNTDLYSVIDTKWWQMLLFLPLLLLISISMFIAFSYMWEGCAIEYGYPKRKIKYINKIKKSVSAFSRLFLIRITFNADRFGFFLILNLICQYINILSMILSLIGLVGCIITHVTTWALLLLIGSVVATNLALTVIMTIPHLICLPSIRARYTFRHQRKK